MVAVWPAEAPKTKARGVCAHSGPLRVALVAPGGKVMRSGVTGAVVGVAVGPAGEMVSSSE